ncbi:MAG: hypothetical protein OXU20_10180, partial [Myxococcales bacterium]|nr:hypothetical protein [Myxococcales bacterium]
MPAILIAALLLGLAPAAARAHGAGAAVVRVLGMDAEQGPWLLQLTEGLAQRRDDQWYFICPAAVGLEERVASALAVGGEGAWLVGEDGPYWLDRSGDLTLRAAALLDTGHVLQLESLDGTVHALSLAAPPATGMVLIALTQEGPQQLFRSSERVATMAAHDGRLWLVNDLGDEALTMVGIDGKSEPETVEVSGWTGGRVVARVREADGQLFVIAIQGNDRFLYRIDGDRLVELKRTRESLHGPVAVDGEVWIAEGNDLERLVGNDVVPLEQDLKVTSLTGHSGSAFACATGSLYRLPLARDGSAVPSLTLDGLLPPAAPGPACEQQWLRFEADLARAGYATSLGQGAGADDEPPDGGALRDVQDANQSAQPSDGGALADASHAREPAGGGCGCRTSRNVPVGARPARPWLSVLLVSLVMLVLRTS